MNHQSPSFPSPDLRRKSILACGGLAAALAFGLAVFFLQREHVPGKLETPASLEIEVTGENRTWTARYAGRDGVFHTADDLLTPGEISVPQGIPVTLHLRSKDYLYLFALPHENLREIAVPDLEFEMDLVATEIGEFELIGGQMCGRPNTRHGVFRVYDRQAFASIESFTFP